MDTLNETTIAIMPEPTLPPAETPPRTPRATRNAGKRKGGFVMPQPVWPVKGLWEAVSPAERAAAHQMGVMMLEHWLGRFTRAELGKQIGQPPVRVWQLSQQALSGMVVGLLKQPPMPPEGTPLPTRKPEDDPKALRKKLVELERKNEILEDLVRILRQLPENREGPQAHRTVLEPLKRRGRPKGKKNRAVTESPRSLAPGPAEPAPTN
jgi:hypothetical protein